MIRKLLFILILTLSLFAQEKKITHVVLCWMKESVTEAEIEKLIAETKALGQIDGIEELTAGRPIPSDRPIVDDSFSFGITMTFSTKEMMNSYLKDERHTSFVSEKIKPQLEKLLVYDIESN